MFMTESFRWYGPDDPVPLAAIRQTGAKGVVSALHELPYGAVWPLEQIENRRQQIARHGLIWNVVESLPVHEDIKAGRGNLAGLFDCYRQSIRHLGRCGIRVITYNFMPVLDWVRTDLAYRLPDGSQTLFYHHREFAALALSLLRRPNAEADYSEAEFQAAKRYFEQLTGDQQQQLAANIVDHLPGWRGTTLEEVRAKLRRCQTLDRAGLQANLQRFLESVIPAAEEAGCTLVIHPDDPPRPILGLPRICGNGEDIAAILAMVDSPANALCFCAGSLSANPANDVAALFRRFADRVGFLHLRSTRTDAEGNFYEANHLEGNVDMFALVKAVVAEQLRRRRAGRDDWRIPFRPDHGHVMLDDLAKPPCPNPGYSVIGRMKGLAELRGLDCGIVKALSPEAIPYLD